MDKKEDSKELQSAIIDYHAGKLDRAHTVLAKLMAKGSMKAGRYLALINFEKAAKRGDITSKIALGNLYEFGIAATYNLSKAKELYQSALADDHQDMQGYMLASGADLGLGRIALLENKLEKADQHFEKVIKGGRPELKKQAELYLRLIKTKGEK